MSEGGNKPDPVERSLQREPADEDMLEPAAQEGPEAASEVGEGGEEPAAKKPRLSSAPKFAPKELRVKGSISTKAQQATEPRSMPRQQQPLKQQQQQQQNMQQLPTKQAGSLLTVAEIVTDKLTKLAQRNWSNAARARHPPPTFKPKLVSSIYRDELGGAGTRGPSFKRVMLLEVSQYLENYLWPNFDPETATFEHVMSIVLMVNEKFRENIPAWACFHTREDAFPGFFKRVLSLKEGREGKLRMHERTAYVLFMIRSFQSLEDEMVRAQVLRVVSLPLWHALSPGRLQLELHAHEALAKHWKAAAKKEAKAAAKKAKAGAAAGEGASAAYVPVAQRPEVRFLPSLLDEFLSVLDKVVIPPTDPGCFAKLDRAGLQYCERFLEFLIDLLSQLPTRRFVRTLLDDRALLIKCRMSKLFKYTQPPPGAAEAAEVAAKAAKAAAQAAARSAGEGARQPTSNGASNAAVLMEQGEGEEEALREGAEEDSRTEGSESEVGEEESSGGSDSDAEGDAERAGGEQEAAAADDAANDAIANGGEADGAGDAAAEAAGPGGVLQGRIQGRGGGRGRGRGRSGGRGRGRSTWRRRRIRGPSGTAEDSEQVRRPAGPPSNTLFRQLVDLFAYYMAFPINDHTGDPLTDDDVTTAHYEKARTRGRMEVCQFQRLCFKHWAHVESLHELALSNCGAVEQRDNLRRHLSAISTDQLRHLVCRQLRLVGEDDPWAADTAFIMEVLVSTYQRRRSQREVVNEMPLYPTEGLLWDESQIPASSEHYTGEGALALPKLNLQFLTTHDYLLRNFHLFRLEATYEIREDISDVLRRIGAYWDDDDRVRFAGWARMALPLNSFKITEVRKPNVGDAKPAAVTANVVIDTRPLRGDVRAEWDELKQHDVLFLMTVRPPAAAAAAALFADGREPNAAEKHGLVYVRGCEVIEVRDEGGRLMNDFTGRVKRDEVKPPEGFSRTLTVALDTAQYQLDMNTMAKHKSEDPYATFNLLMRRKPKENNFKAVLESIRDLMNDETAVIPPWLHDVFLGYGDPAAAQARVPGTAAAAADGGGGDQGGVGDQSPLRTVDFGDTFLDAEHVVTFVNRSGGPQPVPPFRVTFPTEPAPATANGPSTSGTADAASTAGGAAAAPMAEDATGASTAADVGSAPATGPSPGELLVESYVPPDPGPYPQDQPRRNAVRFTPVQVEAIASGVQPGLTMVVGPPGTGKTDTAVQIMTVLYHNCPGQRTLLITHSNQALNDLFSKIMERDVPERYLLRLGMGEAELDTEQDFSRVGRVNAMLARRLELLAEVEKMARQLGVPEAESVAYTCETAGYFWLIHVLARWEKFTAAVERARAGGAGPAVISELFPFKEYFADAPQPLFAGNDFKQDMERARGCFRHLRTLFQELEECRAFEMLKGQADRVNYLSTKQAKIVAMTCTHAALKRREFLQLAFKYDNLLMEEAAQILEIETFIPMLLQKPEDGVSRLKRVVLIGDHHQLPPVVKNQAFQKYSHLDQSLFTRFIRLGTPYVQLNAQGRARPSLARLYNWRYKALGDLPAVQQGTPFRAANPGFAFDFQLVDVPDYLGKGESEPVPYFYQNLGEAEYVVAAYMFMRLLGYPAHKISILTTYNGQKALIRDVVEQRCAPYAMFGRPHRIATVDKYQGAQNDYILLSLVRSRTVGHLRDVRRLVVAMSRARLGLYIFGRKDLFANCYELQPTFRQLLARPTQLALVKGESYGVCARGLEDPVQYDLMPGVEAMSALVAAITDEQVAAAALAAAVPPPYEQQPLPGGLSATEQQQPEQGVTVQGTGGEAETGPQGGCEAELTPKDEGSKDKDASEAAVDRSAGEKGAEAAEEAGGTMEE
ncbi:hypothetical protein VOLCADRAFT_104194 [Volvox carteri f. nagariensis]|uniref:Intron-binding protein aquarius n=1 Tax=Volvox carteri f. nagariensis TaxID=3068 RepID=D8TS23_VOLCA|nr:uncharacterized protein VOLCADRAFT_104194 [Volvox carteri f. nagariensis]EFJ49751.1 hypothetical protein VOLCADRAFT_104194 [Volvox carteri f. nagariensis]|eukprot:XP_002949258.1 hypothetical protein VOLCADRAFT_104194 [Volvox carteri f. nagariensis]